MSETVLLVGGGGREHAIARSLSGDCDLYACASNRNPGIDRLSEGFEVLEETDAEAVVAYAEEVGADLAVVGPESPLEAGVADALDDAGVYAFGPREEEARIETDKAFQREFMQREHIPGCPDFAVFEDMNEACAYIDDYDGDLAVKPAGLTGGKGVRVIGDQVTAEEAKAYLRDADYERVVLEERLVGEEFTVQAFVASEARSASDNSSGQGPRENGRVRVTPAVQDHKRAYEGDEGPNTGGMGSYSDATFELPFMTPGDYEAAVEVIESVVDSLPEYKGVLYGQFMLTDEGPRVVEFNARFGDPEAMNTLPILETPFIDVLTAARDGEELPELVFEGRATVCKYAVPEGYPTDPEGGTKVEVDEESVARAAASATEQSSGDEPRDSVSEAETDSGEALLFYASVDAREDGIYTTTSRSFAVVGIDETITEAERIAEDALAAAGDGLRVRHDIGKPDLVQKRIDHMGALRGN